MMRSYIQSAVVRPHSRDIWTGLDLSGSIAWRTKRYDLDVGRTHSKDAVTVGMNMFTDSVRAASQRVVSNRLGFQRRSTLQHGFARMTE